jgi:drug/metabolite transporter (DMT)-like permease
MARSETRLSAAKRGADHEAYSVLVDQPGREQQAETDRPGGSAVAFMVCGGLAAQGAAFVLLRSYLISEMCDSQVLALSEVFKMLVSLVFLDWSEARRLSERWHVAVIPVAVYGVMNLLSFWSMKRLPATLSIVIVQQKLVFTAICSRVFLGRALLTARSFALAALVFGCISITAYEREAEDSRTFEQQLLASSPSGAEEAGGGGTNRVNAAVVSKSINLLAVLGLTVETALSGLISVYMQVGLLCRVFALLLSTSAPHPIPSPSPSPTQPNPTTALLAARPLLRRASFKCTFPSCGGATSSSPCSPSCSTSAPPPPTTPATAAARQRPSGPIPTASSWPSRPPRAVCSSP